MAFGVDMGAGLLGLVAARFSKASVILTYCSMMVMASWSSDVWMLVESTAKLSKWMTFD